MYVMLTSHNWRKHEFAQDCFKHLMIDSHFPTKGNLVVIYLDCKADEIEVDGLGTVSFPKGIKKIRKTIELDQFSDFIEKWCTAYDELEEVRQDLWYDKIDGLMPEEE